MKTPAPHEDRAASGNAASIPATTFESSILEARQLTSTHIAQLANAPVDLEERDEKPEPIPENEWPPSTILEYSDITATDAYQQYRVHPRELKTLNYVEQYSDNWEPGHYPMHLYREVEVERLAWREHGGPAGWKWL
ncbi:hypothetical protein FA95DRAFT_1576785 [Auriscalpium vulgare]|uniref:Uncharacterized protein n=1 Tax=Auriscalpium vulgare TaxID=40419 RepID=A0ACB8R9E6_9AGAM|nr:hypothetical protein FA95DRAFT_1576785 [Auriscalpium vulgare]